MFIVCWSCLDTPQWNILGSFDAADQFVDSLIKNDICDSDIILAEIIGDGVSPSTHELRQALACLLSACQYVVGFAGASLSREQHAILVKRCQLAIAATSVLGHTGAVTEDEAVDNVLLELEREGLMLTQDVVIRHLPGTIELDDVVDLDQLEHSDAEAVPMLQYNLPQLAQLIQDDLITCLSESIGQAGMNIVCQIIVDRIGEMAAAEPPRESIGHRAVTASVELEAKLVDHLKGKISMDNLRTVYAIMANHTDEMHALAECTKAGEPIGAVGVDNPKMEFMISDEHWVATVIIASPNWTEISSDGEVIVDFISNHGRRYSRTENRPFAEIVKRFIADFDPAFGINADGGTKPEGRRGTLPDRGEMFGELGD